MVIRIILNKAENVHLRRRVCGDLIKTMQPRTPKVDYVVSKQHNIVLFQTKCLTFKQKYDIVPLYRT